VVIINKGKVVAVDTPDNLTARLSGSVTMYLEVAGPAELVQQALEQVARVTKVAVDHKKDDYTAFAVDSQQGTDVRRELAAAVVGRGWGLLELRPMRMSLEDIFLSLTTAEDRPEPGAEAVATPEAQVIS
jgi:ABC-2 type transport system ATP-binding protein